MIPLIPISYNAIIMENIKLTKEEDGTFEIMLEDPKKNVVCYQTWDTYTPLSNGEKDWKTFGVVFDALISSCISYNKEVVKNEEAAGNKFLPTILVFINDTEYYLTVTSFSQEMNSDNVNVSKLKATKFDVNNNDLPDTFSGEVKIYMSKIPSDIIILTKGSSAKFIEWLNPFFTCQGKVDPTINDNIFNKSIQFYFKDNLSIDRGSNPNEFKLLLKNPKPLRVYQVWNKYASEGNLKKRTSAVRPFDAIYEAFATHKSSIKSLYLDKYGSTFNFFPGTIITIDGKNYLVQITDIERNETPNETNDNQNTYVITVINNKYIDFGRQSKNWVPLPLGNHDNVTVNVDSCASVGQIILDIITLCMACPFTNKVNNQTCQNLVGDVIAP